MRAAVKKSGREGTTVAALLFPAFGHEHDFVEDLAKLLRGLVAAGTLETTG